MLTQVYPRMRSYCISFLVRIVGLLRVRVIHHLSVQANTISLHGDVHREKDYFFFDKLALLASFIKNKFHSIEKLSIYQVIKLVFACIFNFTGDFLLRCRLETLVGTEQMKNKHQPFSLAFFILD